MVAPGAIALTQMLWWPSARPITFVSQDLGPGQGSAKLGPSRASRRQEEPVRYAAPELM
jgi:hypothetical protein